MKKNLLYTVLWLMGIMGTLAIWVTKAEYSQVINITWFDVDTPNQLIQSFTQKRDDLELYLVSNTWSISHYTIMDRNMWAEEVFNWDFDSYNTWSFWYQYQWWNNYWFEPCYENKCDTFTNNSGFISTVPYEIWGAYMPSKYARNTWAKGNTSISSNDGRRLNWMNWLNNSSVRSIAWRSQNNIWWWSWDSYNWNWPWTVIDRKGPCPEGYHIPSTYDFEIFSKLRGTTNKNPQIASFSLDLLLPLAWDYRESYDFKIYRIGLGWSYLLSSPKSVYDSDFFSVSKNGWAGHPSEVVNPTARGLFIRCFKNLNNDLSTDFSLHLNWWTKAVIAFTGNVWEWKITALSTPSKSNYIFLGWYDAEIDWNEIKTWSIVPNNLYAKWWCDDGFIENEEKTKCIKCSPWYTINQDWTACEKIRVEFDANGWNFEGWENIFQKEISVVQVPNFETKISHTPNLTDEWEYEIGKIDNSFYYGWTYGWISMAFYQPEYIDSVKIEWAESLNLNIKYAWNVCGWNGLSVPKYIWLWEHLDYGYPDINIAEFTISEIPNEQWTVWEFSKVISWDSITIYKPSSCPDYGRFATVSGTWTLELAEYPDDAFDDIPQLSREWYKFKWWYLADGNEFNTWNVSTWEIINVHAEWQINQYTITFDTDWWSAIEPITADYWTWITAPANPTKNGYKFIGWNKDIPATMPAENLTIKAIWEKLWSSGWGGGWSSRTSSDSEKTTEWQAWSQQPLSPQQASDSSPDREQTVTPLIGGDGEARGGWTQTYTQEFQEAYEFAHEKWITTMPTIQEAQMDWKLTRIAMAKMLSQYAMNVLWQKPANIVTPKFNDVTDKQNSDYDDWVTLAYQLWIMWQNMPNNKFRPDDEVTRAEFATALSRMLYHTSDWEYKSTDKYYTNHMENLVKEWIITNDDPNMKELRWYVMIMLMRSAK